ncbi:MAG: Ribosomal large subunit pseudouridine synthase [Candidatus Peregrinibacteria bacterium GW2011_GWA2_43_8]|nr:MAG: Ribosomal large subunit pseudouridine synthase [Candidatus Peregrinibacteria bacterium GW2011_GWA2_43_8]
MPTTYGKEKSCFVEEVKKSHPELFTFTGFKKEEGGLLYRLDNETSGLLLFAKNKQAFDDFTLDPNLKKIYIAEISNPNSLRKKDTISYPIAHKSSKKMVAILPGKKINYKGSSIETETEYENLGKNHIKCSIKKGTRHQIRVHLAAIGHPIVGDTLYGGEPAKELHLRCVGIESGKLSILIS